MKSIDIFTKAYLNVILEKDESLDERDDVKAIKEMKISRKGFNPTSIIMKFDFAYGFKDDKERNDFIELLKRGISPNDPNSGTKDDDREEASKCALFLNDLKDSYNVKFNFSEFPTFFDMKECLFTASDIINEEHYWPVINSTYFEYFFPKLLNSKYKNAFISVVENNFNLLRVFFTIDRQVFHKLELKNGPEYFKMLVNICAENPRTFKMLLDIADISIHESLVKVLLDLNNRSIDFKLAGNFRLGNSAEYVKEVLLNRYKGRDLSYIKKKIENKNDFQKRFNERMDQMN